MIEKRDIWFIIGTGLILLGLIMSWQVAHAITYSNVGSNVSYVGMGDYIELRAKWTPGGNPYDVSSGAYNDYLDVSSQDGFPAGIAFNNNGSKLYVIGEDNGKVYEYNLSTAYDISTGVYNDYLDVSSQETKPWGIAFNNNGTKLYMCGDDNDRVYEYNLILDYPASLVFHQIDLNTYSPTYRTMIERVRENIIELMSKILDKTPYKYEVERGYDVEYIDNVAKQLIGRKVVLKGDVVVNDGFKIFFVKKVLE